MESWSHFTFFFLPFYFVFFSRLHTAMLLYCASSPVIISQWKSSADETVRCFMGKYREHEFIDFHNGSRVPFILFLDGNFVHR